MVFVDVDGWATRIEESFDHRDGVFSRITIWRETLPIIRDFWLTGIGAGTYSDAMTVLPADALLGRTRCSAGRTSTTRIRTTSRSPAEGGLLLAVPALVALSALWTLARSRASRR